MPISSFQIFNYKSFLKSEELHFSEGFNVVVGQNNAGKTALLEALSLKISDNPHRSVKTVRQPDSPHNRTSSILVTFSMSAEEYTDILQREESFEIGLKPGDDFGPDLFRKRFNESLLKNHKLKCRLDKSGWSRLHLDDDDTNVFNGWSYKIGYDVTNSVFLFPDAYNRHDVQNSREFRLATELSKRVYLFRAERLNLSTGSISVDPVLASNASNLPAALQLLQGNPARFKRFNDYVHLIFPDIRGISTSPIGTNTTRINVWTIDPSTERADLAMPLSECGTGIGQVLAILYVVMTAEHPRTIIIDEPQSFLHPGAIGKLFDILKRHSQHQYIVSTHSPTVVTAANPKTLLMLRKENGESKTEVLNVSEPSELRLFLSEVGARLSDVFGADNILWVEGRTEEVCFRLVAEKVLKFDLLGTEIIGVKQVGDLQGRHAKTVIEIYDRLCKGRGLLPPALAFSFDREGLTEKEMENLRKNSGGMIHFIPRRMYENYLLNPKAIAQLLAEIDKEKNSPVTDQEVESWIDANSRNEKYYKPGQDADWRREVDAAKLLSDLFSDLSEARVTYDKVRHGPKLTEWITVNSPTDFDELATFLKETLGRSPQV